MVDRKQGNAGNAKSRVAKKATTPKKLTRPMRFRTPLSNATGKQFSQREVQPPDNG